MRNTYKVAAIGLGAMGYGMAQSVLRAGHDVWGVDVRDDAMDRFLAEGGQPGSVDDVLDQIDVAMVVVLNADQTEAVLFGENGIVPRMRAGAVVMACATVSPDFARRMEAACATHGIHYLDAPISGGAARAANGDLTIMVSGAPDALQGARATLDATARDVFEMGDAAGAGSAIKAVNQILAGVHIATMAEAMAFGMTQGISPEKFMEILPTCGGTSWMLENRGPHIVDADYTPLSAVDIWPKDLSIVLDIAKSARMPAPLTAAALQQFNAASGMGYGREDDAAVIKVYARSAGLTLPGE